MSHRNADKLRALWGVDFQDPDAEGLIQNARGPNLLRGAQGQQMPVFQHRDPVPVAQGQGQVVEDHRHRLSLIRKLPAQGHQIKLTADVQEGCGLVQQQGVRPLGQGHGQITFLPGAAGQRRQGQVRQFGNAQPPEGIIDAPIARREKPSLLRYVSPEGKPSVTEYRVLERNGALCKLALQPITGRTHQLRVHCAHIGFPILGDPQYGSEESQALSAKLGLTHQMLCARRLEFAHPITGKQMTLESNMDAVVK